MLTDRLPISVLDQSTLAEGGSPSKAIQDTVLFARALDRLGCRRLWLSEHHNMSILQGSTPEVLLSSIGAQTDRIRLGSGGVMLPNHSAYHVAENFRMLEALYPGRIDCGIGRASGGDALSRSLLAPSVEGWGQFPDQIDQLNAYFHDQMRRTIANPRIAEVPPMWLLSAGSSPESGVLAAENGLGLALALFINPDATPAVVKEYKRKFRPSAEFAEPRVILALNFVCADNEDTLKRRRKVSDFFRLMRDSGRYPSAVPSSRSLEGVQFSAEQTAYLHRISNREIVGLPRDAHAAIRERAAQYDADEIMLTMMAYEVEEKIDAFTLLRELETHGIPATQNG